MAATQPTTTPAPKKPRSFLEILLWGTVIYYGAKELNKGGK